MSGSASGLERLSSKEVNLIKNICIQFCAELEPGERGEQQAGQRAGRPHPLQPAAGRSAARLRGQEEGQPGGLQAEEGEHLRHALRVTNLPEAARRKLQDGEISLNFLQS